MPEKSVSTRGTFFNKLFGNLFNGWSRAPREDKVRAYIANRLHHEAHLAEVIQEEYVRRNCSEEEINEIIRDPRLIHDERTSLHELFESGELDPASDHLSR